MMRIFIVGCLILAVFGCATHNTSKVSNSSVTNDLSLEDTVDEFSLLSNSDDPIDTFIYAFVQEDGQNITINRDVNYYRAMANLLWQYPDDARLLAILENEAAPLVLVSVMVEDQLQRWLNAPYDVELDIPSKPVQEIIRKPVLLRGEFESRVEFNNRLQQAQVEYNEAQMQVVREYQRLLKIRQDSLDLKKQLEVDEKSTREEAKEGVYQQLLNLALSIVLGEVFFVSADYDADTYNLFLQMSSTRAKVSRNLSVLLSPQIAQLMAQQLNQVVPYISVYENQNGTLVLGGKANLVYEGQTYEALAVDYVDIPELTLRRVR